MLKLGLITAFLGQTKDRFTSYNEPKTFEEKFQMMNRIKGFDGVEIVYPYETPAAEETKALLKKYDLSIAAINVNIKNEPEFKNNGGISSPEKAVRQTAVQFIKDAKDYAEAAGADKVTCCPLGDGYEFAFHVDYIKSWDYLIEGFGQAAAYKPEIPLMIEYKPNEIRSRCFLNDASKTLCLLNEIKSAALGVTLDFGHSIYGGENPAEALALIHHSNVPYYIHINDNDGKWDWDFFCGTKHLLEYAEFIYYLRKFNYSDYLTSDTSPTRWDILRTFEINGRVTQKLWNVFDTLDMQELQKLIESTDYLNTWDFVEQQVLGLK